MAFTLMNSTLPTIIGMHVVSTATTKLFGKNTNIKGPRSKHGLVVVAVAPTRKKAEQYAVGYRKALKRKGISFKGKVSIRKFRGGFAVLHNRG